jgi:hypothetical protein
MNELIIDLPKEDVDANWRRIQEFASSNRIQIAWDSYRHVLRVEGQDFDSDYVLDSIIDLLSSQQEGSQTGFRQEGDDWLCSIELAGIPTKLRIRSPTDASRPKLDEYRNNVEHQINDSWSNWLDAAVNEIYEDYMQQFAHPTPATREQLRESLNLETAISFKPKLGNFEFRLISDQYIDSHAVVVGVSRDEIVAFFERR